MTHILGYCLICNINTDDKCWSMHNIYRRRNIQYRIRPTFLKILILEDGYEHYERFGHFPTSYINTIICMNKIREFSNTDWCMKIIKTYSVYAIIIIHCHLMQCVPLLPYCELITFYNPNGPYLVLSTLIDCTTILYFQGFFFLYLFILFTRFIDFF